MSRLVSLSNYAVCTILELLSCDIKHFEMLYDLLIETILTLYCDVFSFRGKHINKVLGIVINNDNISEQDL